MAEPKPFEVIMRIDFSENNGVEVVAHAEKVQELVRCKDCVHRHHTTCPFLIANAYKASSDDDFCSRGERREDVCD